MHLLHAGCPPLPHPRARPPTENHALTPGVSGPHPAGAPVFAGRTDDGWTFEVFDRCDALDPLLWPTVVPPDWKDDRYHQTLEETFAGQFTQFYLVLRDETGRARALQPLFLAVQDVSVGLPPWLRAWLRPARRLLRWRLLMVGCIVGEGRISVPDPGDVRAVAATLDEALTRFAERKRAQILVFKDLPSGYRPAMRALTARGRYTRLPSLPAVRLALDFASFEEYVQRRLGKSTRKSLRRKFREIDALAEPIRREVKTRLTMEEAVVLHALYERVAQGGKTQFEVFDAAYFYRLGERMPEQTRFFVWRHGGEVVAFGFCTVHGDTLHDNDLGMHEAWAHRLHLYHVTFRDIVRWALAQGLRHYRSSPFNYAPKRSPGLELVPLDLYGRHLSAPINVLLRWFAPLASPARHKPLLRQFPVPEFSVCVQAAGRVPKAAVDGRRPTPG